MAKKDLNAFNPASGFFTTPAADQTQGAQPVKEEGADDQGREYPDTIPYQEAAQAAAQPKKTGRPATGIKRPYKYNIALDADLWKYLHEISWTRRKPMVQIVNDLIRADMEAYIKDCNERGVDPYEGWEKDD